MTRKDGSPSSSSRSARSSSCSATSLVLRKRRATTAIIGRRCARRSASPPTTSARTSSGWCARSATDDVRVLVDRRQLAGRHRRDRRPPRGGARLRSTCSTASARRGSGPRTSPASAARSPNGAELILEMDCDFSHDPADVPRLIAAAEDGADLVLGSRYVPGGGESANWGLVRRFISRGGCVYAQLCCRRGSATSPAGSSATGAPVLETIDLDAIDSKGYAFQIESTYRDAAQGLPRRGGADHVRRPRGGRVEDVARDRARGDLEGAAAAARSAAGRAV